jgi:hypothetical protein
MYAASDVKPVRRGLLLLATWAILPLLAGCASSPPAELAPAPSPTDTRSDQLANGTFYAFMHGAGDGSAEIVLYGADDRRLGHIGVGAGQARGRFVLDDVEAGELVLHALAVNGTLDLRSGGDRVEQFRALPVHVERHVLAERAYSFTDLTMLTGGEPVDETIEVELLRAPSEMTALVRGTYESLDVSAAGRSGTVYEAYAGGGVPAPPTGVFFDELMGEFHDENVRDGSLTVEVHASGFGGLLLLEARSFSRAAPAPADARLTEETPRFTYGVLPDQPVSFEVRSGATELYLWQEDPPTADELSEECEEAANADEDRCDTEASAHVALFGPQDQRVGTLAVPANGTLAIPVGDAGPGTWVAVLLDGEATLGADRVPGDFELHPIEAVETTLPAQAAGGDDRSYGHDRRDLDADGIPYRLTAVTVQGGPTGSAFDPSSDILGFGGCDSTTLSVLLGGETLGAWGYDSPRTTLQQRTTRPIDPSLLLDDGELEVAYADFGAGCDRIGVVVEGYER